MLCITHVQFIGTVVLSMFVWFLCLLYSLCLVVW